MGSSNIRDILTAFSPSLDYFAISSGDGRIKIWDTLKGQIQTEFADFVSSEATNIYPKAERGHLSIDYKCMKWLSFDKKKKRKLASSLLILGTGSGDLLALDVSAGQLKWRVSDCHPGGVSAIAFSTNGSCIYSAGADGMVCKIDSLTGNLLGKFRASTKSISSMAVSSDGKMLVTAAAQLRTFDCSNHKKIQKFTGHPGSVRCMIFTEDGKLILSSALGERYIAVWRTDGSKKQSASCVLAMEHPAVFIDSRCVNDGDLYVFAISETGVCYFWYGQDVEKLRNAKPTKVSLSLEAGFSKTYKGALPTIFAAKLQGIAEPASVNAFLAQGLLVKPSFQKIVVHYGTDILLSCSQDGVLLPMSQSLNKSKKGLDSQNRAIALDRAHAEDAILPIPKIFGLHGEKERYRSLSVDADDVMVDSIRHGNQAKLLDGKGDMIQVEADSKALCMEDRLRTLRILDDLTSNSSLDSMIFDGINLEANVPPKKMRAVVSSMVPSDAHKLLENLVGLWQSRSNSEKYVLPWIYSVLVNHGPHIMSQESLAPMLNSLLKTTRSRGLAIQPLLQLSGRLQLVTAQIDKAAQSKSRLSTSDHQMDESEDEDEDEDEDDVDEVIYREEDDESQLSSDDDN
ncbi:PREDICTED: WD repeat-containing protein 43 isoform X2 [Theobroma cacao]|nr:PREDICTED: WD repeat-containing protein 43 isoform X2 [Theobroma cacao]